MMNNRPIMTPYPEYKATNLPWLPQIPAHWEVKKNKYLLKQREEVSQTGSELLLSLSQYTGITAKKISTGRLSETLVGYKIVNENDIVMNIMLAWNGSTAMSTLNGVVSPAYAVFRVVNNTNPKFLHYLFKTPQMLQYFKAYSSGVIESRLRLYPDELSKLFSIIPPANEQEQIVRYLDSMTAKINKLIRAKKKQIALLQEQKQNIISTTMTSEIEASKSKWEVMRLKHTTNVPLQYGANAVGIPFDENEIRYIRITDIDSHGNLKISEKQSLPKEIGKEYKLQNGDILFARCGGTVGKTYLYNPKDGICCYAGYLIRYRPNKAVLPEYIYLYTQSSVYKKWLQQIFIQATIQNVSAEKYKNLTILIPLLAEQKNIVLYLKKVLSEAENIIQTIERQISCLIEYKNSLIASVVTGQVDVRNIQVEEFDPADLITETDDDPAEDDEQPQEESEE